MEAAAFWFVQLELQLAFGKRETAAFGEARWGFALTFVHHQCRPCTDLSITPRAGERVAEHILPGTERVLSGAERVLSVL